MHSKKHSDFVIVGFKNRSWFIRNKTGSFYTYNSIYMIIQSWIIIWNGDTSWIICQNRIEISQSLVVKQGWPGMVILLLIDRSKQVSKTVGTVERALFSCCFALACVISAARLR